MGDGYFSKDTKIVLADLKTNEKGLKPHQAEVRLHKYGFNELHVKKGTSAFKIFLQQFISPLVWILLAALGISIYLNEMIDAIVIGIIVLVNAILGFVQEYRAEKAIEALKRMASPKAHVIRNGKEELIESRRVVPGDILILETGDKIAADARIIESFSLKTQEGPLTGESSPVSKQIDSLPVKTALADRKNMLFSSTVVTSGRGKAVVTQTGMNTQVGKIASLIQDAGGQLTPLQKKLQELGKYLTIAVIVIAIVVFLTGVFAAGQDMHEMFLAAIALSVAAIPEGLPAVITIALALGVQRMVKKNALVRKLPSVETLGSVDVICTDKTGTLTHNEMTVRKVWMNNTNYSVTGAGYQSKGHFLINGKKVPSTPLSLLLRIGALCNDAKLQGKNNHDVFGDPTEAALLVSAEKAGLSLTKLQSTYPRKDEIGFSSERKQMTTIHKVGNKKVAYSKGAPDVIVEKCDRILLDGRVQRMTRSIKKKILEQNEHFALEALRVLGFAYNDNFKSTEHSEKNMIFVGLQGMIDPPRAEAKISIKTCQEAGIRVIMITGDHITTAKAIAHELGIEGKAVLGEEIDDMRNFSKKIKNISIFARVNPEHKLKIVNALKKNGHIVAMTGDGVNDAPALKKADIGVAMGKSGTDVAKEAADMILTDDNFSSIVHAVEEGRGIFDNIRKFVNYLLSSNLGEVTAIFVASLLRMDLPLTAIQILWVNLVTDGLPATALSVDPHSKGIMKKKPRPPKESIISKELKWDIIIFGVLIGLFTVGLFWLYRESSLEKARTMAFTSLVLFELVRLQTIRRDYNLGIMSNTYLIVAVIASIILHLATIYTPAAAWFKTAPLQLVDWGVLIVASLVLFVGYKIAMWVYEKFWK